MFNFIFDDVILPIAPDKITMTVSNKNKTIDLVSIGEINLIKDIGLRSYAFEVLLPRIKYPFMPYQMEFKEPLYYLNKFRSLKVDKKDFTFETIRNMPDGTQIFSGSLKATLEEYSVKEVAGEEGDFWVSLNLKEYRLPQVKTIVPKEPEKNKTSEETVATEVIERESKEAKGQYTVVKGDTLRGIAKRELNDESRFREIAEINGIKDPNKIYVGQVLELP